MVPLVVELDGIQSFVRFCFCLVLYSKDISSYLLQTVAVGVL